MRYKKVDPFSPPEEKPKRPWKRVIQLMISSIVVVGLYIAGMRMQLKWVVYLYYIALLALSLGFVLLNRGIDTTLPTPDMLPDKWTDEEKTVFIEKEKKRKKIAKNLLLVLIPLMLTFAVDLLYMAFFAGN